MYNQFLESKLMLLKDIVEVQNNTKISHKVKKKAKPSPFTYNMKGVHIFKNPLIVYFIINYR